MAKKRKDNKGRVLKKGESQRKDLTYMYRWVDRKQDRKTIYAKTLDRLREEEHNIIGNYRDIFRHKNIFGGKYLRKL